MHLIHEIRDDSVEVNPIVKSPVRKVDEISARDGHLIRVELGLESPLGRYESSNSHCRRAFRFSSGGAINSEMCLKIFKHSQMMN